MGCGGSKEKKKQGGSKPEPGSKTKGQVPPEIENLKSLKNLNEDKPAIENAGARKAKNKPATMKGFDDSDEEEKSTTTVVKPGVGPKGKPPPVVSVASAEAAAKPSGPSKASQMAAQQAELAAMFAAKAEKARKAEEAEEAKKNGQNDDCNVDQFGESHPERGDEIEEGKEEVMEVIDEQNDSVNDDASDNATVLAKNHGSHIFQDRNSLLKSNLSRGFSQLENTRSAEEPGPPLIIQESDDILVGQTRPSGTKSEFVQRPSNPFPIADGAGENRN